MSGGCLSGSPKFPFVEPKSRRKVTVPVRIDEDLRVRMIQLRVWPTAVAKRAFIKEVKRMEKKLELLELQKKDPRMTERHLHSRSVRVRRLRGI